MKILVVSHNAIGPSTNVGITLKNVFRDFGANNVAEFFVKNEEPCDTEVCENYFRITDKDAMRGVLFHGNLGRAFEKDEIDRIKIQKKAAQPAGTIEKIRTMHRTPLLDLGREIYWALCPWYSEKLRTWLKKVKPDILYFAAGDYAFSYKIALKIAKKLQIPLIVACYDDFFFYTKGEGTFWGTIRHKSYMRTVKKVMAYASKIVTICEPMAQNYKKLFGKDCIVLYTPAVPRNICLNDKGKTIGYFGTLGLGRDDQLVSIGRAVAKTSDITGIDHIDVYTTEKREEARAKMIPQNGIILHKAVSFENMLEIYQDSIAVIHTESHDPIIRKRVKYSISTKIPEALSYGPCLFAYGPAEVASIDYLKKNDIAYVATKEKELEQRVIDLLSDETGRKRKIENARKIADVNHNSHRNYCKLRECFENAIEEYSKYRAEADGLV